VTGGATRRRVRALPGSNRCCSRCKCGTATTQQIRPCSSSSHTQHQPVDLSAAASLSCRSVHSCAPPTIDSSSCKHADEGGGGGSCWCEQVGAWLGLWRLAQCTRTHATTNHGASATMSMLLHLPAHLNVLRQLLPFVICR
jgi:hypothetical protein